MRVVVQQDPTTIQDPQFLSADGGVGVADVILPTVPTGINRLVLHASVGTDDTASRKVQLFIRAPGPLLIGMPCSMDGIVMDGTTQRSSALEQVLLPPGWTLHAQISGSVITAGKKVNLQIAYLDIFRG